MYKYHKYYFSSSKLSSSITFCSVEMKLKKLKLCQSKIVFFEINKIK